MMIVDKACAERGCPCYDSRDGEEGVEMMRKEWVMLTTDEVRRIGMNEPRIMVAIREAEMLSRERNT
jgi:hypothetical protein